MDRLTLEEAHMAAAELLRISHNIESGVIRVDEGVQVSAGLCKMLATKWKVSTVRFKTSTRRYRTSAIQFKVLVMG